METSEMTYIERMKSLGCIVIVPTYNNAGTVADVVRDVKEYCEDILVVNDGSTDNTQEILESIQGIQIISYKKNMGKGYALKKGLKHAYDNGFKYAITIDSDGQHYADDLPVFIKNIELFPGSLLIGGRNLNADNMPSKNTFANRFSNFWFRVETGQKLSDTQSGYRLYPLESLQNMHMITSRYEFEVEIIVRAAWRGVKVKNIPIKVYYPPEEERVSHFRPFKDFFRISILNTILVLYAILIHYPFKLFRSISREKVKMFMERNVFKSSDSNFRMSASIGWGVLWGIIPVWGYQMVLAGVTAHFFKLNKVVSMVFSNISSYMMIPLIVFASTWIGSQILGEPCAITFQIASIKVLLEAIGDGMGQYILGSLILGLSCGLIATIISWLMMTIFKRRPYNA